MNKKIEAVEVRREADGSWTHPGMPEFEEDGYAYQGGEFLSYAAWKDAQGLEIQCDNLDGMDEDHPAFAQYWEREEGFSEWEPKPPAGEGWFLLAISDTEDGPTAWYGRRAA
jgi:integrase/recombinase XerC